MLDTRALVNLISETTFWLLAIPDATLRLLLGNSQGFVMVLWVFVVVIVVTTMVV